MKGMIAITPIDNQEAANAHLEEEGFGPNNFSTTALVDGVPTYALLHAWPDEVFEAALEATDGVTLHIYHEGGAQQAVAAVLADYNAVLAPTEEDQEE